MLPEMEKGYVHIPSDVQEVGRLSTVQGKNVHRGHRQASAVDEAPDVAIKFDKVQVRFLCLNLGRFLLRYVTEVEYIFLAELGVIVKAKLGVHTTKKNKVRQKPILSKVYEPENSAVSCLSEGVDLNLRCVFFLKDPI